MKLKFRAEPKDIAIFLVFSLFLLYLVCLIILNLSSFAQNGTLHGLNPLPAFESKYVSEDYAKEYINILLEANRLRKNGDFIGTKIIMIE